MASFLEILSQIFGWVYTISWSLSFYPQPLLNFRRKSTSGTTIDFPVINILGFLAYFTSNVVFLYSPVIREQYSLRHHGLTPTVEFNDLAFAGHAVILSVLTYTQFFPWIWGFDKKGRNGNGAKVSKAIMGIFIGCITGVVITAIIVASSPKEDVRTGWAWIDVVRLPLSWQTLILTNLSPGLRRILRQDLHHLHQIHASNPHQLPEPLHPRLVNRANPPGLPRRHTFDFTARNR